MPYTLLEYSVLVYRKAKVVPVVGSKTTSIAWCGFVFLKRNVMSTI